MRSFYTLEVGQVALLVKGGALKAEGADNVVDLDHGVIEILSSLLGGSVGADV
jgi:hypothetical protein